MRNIGIARDLERSEPLNDAAERRALGEFAPAEFFQDAGIVIAICLGLGLLVQFLLG